MNQPKLPDATQLDMVDDASAAILLNTPLRARILLWCCFLFFICAIGWAAWAKLDEVTVGQGKVIPSRQLQVVQNLEGGIVKEVFVREGQQVEEGQELMRIDDTRFRSDYREREQELAGLQGDVARLRAELDSIRVRNETNIGWREQVQVEPKAVNYPDGFETQYPDYVTRQNNALQGRLNNLRNRNNFV